MQRTLLVALSLTCFASPLHADQQLLRPPAVPLVTHDPYFSIWSVSDRLADCWPRHWTGAVNALSSMVRVDGKTYRLMGPEPNDVPPATQRSLRVLPTRTIYQFEAGGVLLDLTFCSPLLPDDLDILSRPVSYLTWTARSQDAREHEVAVYYDNSAELVVNQPDQQVTWSQPTLDGLAVIKIGSVEQPVLAKDGDNLRIDWGYLYVAAPADQSPRMAVAAHESARRGFAANGRIPAEDDARKPRAANDDWPVCACVLDLGRVGSQPQSRWLMLAYDDLYSIQYLKKNLRPWWRRNGIDAPALLAAAHKDYPDLSRRAAAFDDELMADLRQVGGPEYADLCAMAYREAIAAHKLAASADGVPLLFSKECFSNGCIATVDVMYPASPIFMLFSRDLLEASFKPVCIYARQSGRWPFKFAPHDLGRYPKANGQVYGGREASEENQMPVEECGNLLIMAAALAQIDGRIDALNEELNLLGDWAVYLKNKGLDPENQLCTDDFAGHLAHNANLSVKAIVALGCYAKMCQMKGQTQRADEYRRLAESFAAKWVDLAADGDHYRLAFDKPGTWSQKYNLVWDTLLDLNLFPKKVAQTEIAYYKTKLQPFGLPLDNRKLYTKTDWEVWTATLASSRADFDVLMKPLYAFVSQTPKRVPLSDWYWTQNAQWRGFQARPVIGGVFIKMLSDPQIWAKWAKRAKSQASAKPVQP